MFFCEYCEIFKNFFFIDYLWRLFVNFFTESQKEMAQLWRRLNILSQLILHLTCQYSAQKVPLRIYNTARNNIFLAWISLLS